MKQLFNNKFTLVTIAYWFLLVYIIAALLWWFISLHNQNTSMAGMRLAEINKDDVAYAQKAESIVAFEKRKTTQYIGEGITFLALILVGAMFIYRAIRRQIKFAQQQQNFMMAVTHELKTPIAITQLNLETIQKRSLSTQQLETIVGNSLSEVKRLGSLCNNILWAAQLDDGSYIAKKELVNCSEVISNCINNFKKAFASSPINSSIEPNIYLTTDLLMIEMLANNLIENALKYSAANEAIFIELKKHQTKVKLTVSDYGVGIPNDEKKRVFDKFYRSGSEATRQTKGTGLGLYLCKKIIAYNKGKISVADNKPQGCIFSVEI